MVETVSDLHNDLKICNQKSILLTASLEQAQGILFGTGIRQESRTRVLGKLKQGRALQDVFHDKKDPAKSKTFHNDDEEDSSDSEEVRLIRRPRPPVNPQLRQTISQLNTRVNRIKNGKSSNAQLLTREAQMPRALQHFRENRRSQNLTPDPGRRSVSPMFMTETDSSRISSKSPLLQSSTTLSTYRDKSATPPLPHISLTSGKTQDPLKLPTFDEFCTQQQLILSEGPSKEKAFQKIQNTGKILGNLKTELSGLEYYLTANRGVPWNGDKGLLRELEKHPIQRKELLRKYNKKFVNRMRTKRTGSLIKRASTIGQRFSVLRKGRKRMGILPQVEMNAAIADMINPENYIDEEQEVISSEQLINSKLARLAQNKIYDLKEEKPELEQIEQKVKNLRQAKNCLTTATNEFIKSKDDQNQRLNAILQRLEQDRPTNTSKKIQLIRSDKSQYTTHGHSLNKFASFKRKIQSEKKMILQENKEQEQLYEEMLEHLKQQNTYPSEDEEGYLLLIKELLEEGIAITEHEFYLILESFDVHSIPGSRLEKLISVVREWIGIVPVEWYGWLKRQGVILPSNILRKYKHLRNISVKQ